MTQNNSAKRIRWRGRSFMSLMITPEGAMQEWLTALDDQIQSAGGFFANKPIIIDLSMVKSDFPVNDFVEELRKRNLLPLAVDGCDANSPLLKNCSLPMVPKGGKEAEVTPQAAPQPKPKEVTPTASKDSEKEAPAAPQATGQGLVIDRPLRSGQEIYFPDGDVTVIGGVSWGAEIMAGGSIHVYGPLRGRAIAGLSGQKNAAIFTTSFEAQLTAINGFYQTLEECDKNLINKPVQIRQSGNGLKIEPLGGSSK